MMMVRLIICCCCLCALSSCSKKEWALLPSSSEITLGMKTDAYTTRTSINNLSYLAKVGGRIGIYAITDWTETAVMQNVRTTEINTQTGALYWENSYYYPYRRNVCFYSYHPYAPYGEEGDIYMEERADNSPILHFTLTGEEDLMYADPVIGSDETPPPFLAYNHLLTQFHFVIVDEGDFKKKNIEHITFAAVNTSSTLHIENGMLGNWFNPQNILFPSSYPIQITGTEDTPQSIPGSIMLQPGLKKLFLEIEIAGKGVFYDICITPKNEPVFASGHSYEITLTFSKGNDGNNGDGGETIKTEIKTSAWVTPWRNGGNGSGQVGE